MKDRPLGKFSVIGIDACKGFVPDNEKLLFADTDEKRGALAVTDGKDVYGFVTGNHAFLVKAAVSVGEEVYCVKESETMVNASKVCVVNAYRKFKKI